MKRDLSELHTISTLQDASRFHDFGVGKTTTRFSNIGDLNTFHKGYASALYRKGKSPMDLDAVRPYNGSASSTGKSKDF